MLLKFDTRCALTKKILYWYFYKSEKLLIKLYIDKKKPRIRWLKCIS